MNYQDVTKEELIKELQELQQKYSSLEESYSKDISERVKAEEALKKSEEKWRKLITTIPDFIALHDLEGRYIFLNHYSEGFSEEDVIGKSLYDFISEDSKEKFRLNFDACLHSKQTQRFVYTAFGNNRVLRTYDSYLIPIIEKDQIVNVMAIGIDITERVKAELELQLQSEIMKNITEGINLVSYEDEIIVFTNPKFDEMFGYEHGELIGEKISVVNAPTDKSPEETKRDVMDILDKKGEWHGEIRNIKKDGDHFWCYANVSIFDHSDHGKVFLSVHSDITQRKLAEEVLVQQNNALSKLANYSIGLSKLTLKDSLEAFISRKLKEITGAEVAIFSEYNPTNRTLNAKHIEIEPELLEKAVSLLGQQINRIHTVVSDKIYRKMTEEIIGTRTTLSKATFGAISRQTGAAIQTLLKADRFIGLAYLIQGKLYGTSLIVMRKDQHDVTREILEYFIFLSAVSLQRKMAEEALQKSEARFRGLFENSLVGISAASKYGRLIYANMAYARMYGYENPEIMLSEVTNVTKLYVNPEVRNTLIRMLNRYGKMKEKEFEVIRRDGSRFFVLVAANEVRDANGKLLYYQAAHMDLTERKKTEEKIHEASLYARKLIEASLDPLVTINSKGKITDLNLATELITGINRENLIGSDFADYFTEPDKARKGYKTVFSKGEVKNYPLSILHKSGRIIDVLYNATLFKNEAGVVQGVFAAARDITERKKMEADLRNSKKSLEKLNQHLLEVRESERSQIALNLHDDFGQRLTALNLDIAWLKSRMGVQSESVRKKFEEMSLMIKDSIESIREVSTFLRPAVLYELGLVPAIGEQLKKFEKQSGIHCQYTFYPRDIKIDDGRSLILYRILQEALTNIVRHSEAITVAVDIRLERNRIEMVIKDNGKGIDESEINSLYSMGIAGMMERVRSVSGRMSIKGEKGSGTIMKISIPLKNSKKNDQSTYN